MSGAMGTAVLGDGDGFPALSERQLLVLCVLLPERPERGARAFDIAWPDELRGASRDALAANMAALLDLGVVQPAPPLHRYLETRVEPTTPLDVAGTSVRWLTETAAHGHIAEDMQAFVSDPTGEQLRVERAQTYSGPEGWAPRHDLWIAENVRRLDEALRWPQEHTPPGGRPGNRDWAESIRGRARAENLRVLANYRRTDPQHAEWMHRGALVMAEELVISTALAVGDEAQVDELRATTVRLTRAAGWEPDAAPLGAARDVLFPLHPLL